MPIRLIVVSLGLAESAARNEEWSSVLEAFEDEALPVMQKVLLNGDLVDDDWKERQESVWAMGEEEPDSLVDLFEKHAAQFSRDGAPLLRDLFSLMAIRRERSPDVDVNASFWKIYQAVYDSHKESWMTGLRDWTFQETDLPSLRPTIVSETGLKVPPLELLMDHDGITFVAATGGQLASQLSEAFSKRKGPWESLEVFFASKQLLEVDGAKRSAEFRR